MSLSDQLRTRVIKHRELPAEIARAAGVNKSMLSRLVNRQRSVSVETLEAIADAIGLEVRLVPKGAK